MKLKFKAYSLKNPDSSNVYREGRERGMKIGEQLLVFGSNLHDSEFKLNVIRTIFEDNKNCKFLTNNQASFEVEIDGTESADDRLRDSLLNKLTHDEIDFLRREFKEI